MTRRPPRRSRSTGPVRARGAAGSAAVECSAGIALLLLPVVLLVALVPTWAERQGLARVAARDAARGVALVGWCDRAGADAVVADHTGDLPADAARLDLDCTPGAPLARGGAVTARVTVAMPALVVPALGVGPGWQWTAVHRHPVDPYGSRP